MTVAVAPGERFVAANSAIGMPVTAVGVMMAAAWPGALGAEIPIIAGDKNAASSVFGASAVNSSGLDGLGAVGLDRMDFVALPAEFPAMVAGAGSLGASGRLRPIREGAVPAIGRRIVAISAAGAAA